MNPLIDAAERLARGGAWHPCGYVEVRRPITSPKMRGEYVIFHIAFYGEEELEAVKKWVLVNGYEGFSDHFSDETEPAGKVEEGAEPPMCPVHHKPMLPSQLDDGWFCPRRVRGGYCRATRPA